MTLLESVENLLDRVFNRTVLRNPYHIWESGPLVEEGIDPQWARKTVTCVRCGEQRLVWRFVDMESMAMKLDCPGVITHIQETDA